MNRFNKKISLYVLGLYRADSVVCWGMGVWFTNFFRRSTLFLFFVLSLEGQLIAIEQGEVISPGRAAIFPCGSEPWRLREVSVFENRGFFSGSVLERHPCRASDSTSNPSKAPPLCIGLKFTDLVVYLSFVLLVVILQLSPNQTWLLHRKGNNPSENPEHFLAGLVAVAENLLVSAHLETKTSSNPVLTFQWWDLRSQSLAHRLGLKLLPIFPVMKFNSDFLVRWTVHTHPC